MPNFETITICGHLGKDAIMRDTSAGHVTEFTVAVNHGKKDNRQVTWYTVNCWHGTAKACANLHKGDPVICIGNMRCRKWEEKYYWTLQATVVGKALYEKQERSAPPPEDEPPDEALNDPGADEESEPF